MKRKDFTAYRQVDAITNERIGEKSITIPIGNSGDVLQYNTSTLIRIAEEYGMFMQPPYFREAAKEELVKEISKIEGKAIVITKKNRRQTEGVDSTTGVQHQMEGFADFMNTNHEPLSSKNFYYCPVCYDKSIDEYLHEQKEKIHTSSKEAKTHEDPMFHRGEGSCDEKETVDPLDVFSILENKSQLNSVLFAKAKDWKTHIYKHHYIACIDNCSQAVKPNALFSRLQLLAGDYTVRMNVNAYISKFNRHLGLQQMYHKMHGTTKQYWHCDAHFNVFRYNRLVDSMCRSDPDLEHSICMGDPKRLLGDPDGSSESDSSVNSCEESEASSHSPSENRHQYKEESGDLEGEDLLEIARYYTKRAKREKYEISDEGSVSSDILSETSQSESSVTSKDSNDPRNNGPMSNFFSMDRGRLTPHERLQMEKMALKEEILHAKPGSSEITASPRERTFFSAKQAIPASIREQISDNELPRDEKRPISPADRAPHALIYDTE